MLDQIKIKSSIALNTTKLKAFPLAYVIQHQNSIVTLFVMLVWGYFYSYHVSYLLKLTNQILSVNILRANITASYKYQDSYVNISRTNSTYILSFQDLKKLQITNTKMEVNNLFPPKTLTWNPVLLSKGSKSGPTARWGHTMTLANDSIYIFGGYASIVRVMHF